MDCEESWRPAMYLFTIVIALVSARPHAEGWADGSRLATVESLVDRHTWAIDDSMFLTPTAEAYPYDPENQFTRHGTLDKLRIGGHWYSDKSPLLALWLAAWYQVLQWSTGLVARMNPGWFCYLMTILSSGLAYVISVTAIERMARVVGLQPRPRMLLTISFGLATLTLVYARTINNHLPFLAATSLMVVQLAYLSREGDSARRWLILGMLASFGYAFDLGAGPPLVLALGALAVYRSRAGTPVLWYFAGALPIFLVHHAFNFHVGGTFLPANSVAEYVQWPGSPFSDMTGKWHHASFFRFLVYAAELLFGKSGFVLHDLPLILLLPALIVLGRRSVPERPEIWAGIAASLGMWMVYAISSRNFAGGCCSIRWLLPAVAPGFFALAVYLRECPRAEVDLSILSLGGMLMMASAWAKPMWASKYVPGFWFILVGTLLAWGITLSRRSAATRHDPIPEPLATAG